eukprot:TRINITY_DN6469_c0_g1_i3.p1 TRINITY_DN6469_c0_g1~~TRINITY_DN6469_c0_g1_i3.p1  ORF type:complete len:1258 (+),score=247.97 TRINITY_DN6469_c0_g1_i3:62-3835(+)
MVNAKIVAAKRIATMEIEANSETDTSDEADTCDSGMSMDAEVQASSLFQIGTLAKNVMVDGAKTGRLQAAISRIKQAKADDIVRDMAKRTLAAASLSGELSRHLAEIQQSRDVVPPSECEGIRLMIRETLSTAAEDGSLQAALSQVRPAGSHYSSAAEEDGQGWAELKVKAREALVAALLGQPQQSPQPTMEIEEDFHVAAKRSIMSGAVDGRLRSALAALTEGRRKANEEYDEFAHTERLRLQAKALIVEAFEEGRLSRVLQSAISATRKRREDSEDVESEASLRKAAFKTLLHASQTGALQTLLGQVRPADIEEARAARLAAQAALTQGALDGRLKVALGEIEPPGVPKVERLRQEMCSKVVDAALDGRLNAALKSARENCGKASQQQGAKNQELVKGLLVSSLSDGRLDRALADIRQARQVEASFADAASKAQDVRASAAAAGTLEKALETSQASREADNQLARKLAVSSLSHGRLASALVGIRQTREVEASFADAVSKAETSEQDIRAVARHTLVSAAFEGRLTAAVDEVKHVCRETSQEDIRAVARHTLVSAAFEGRLTAAVDEVKHVCRETSQEDIRAVARHTLVSAAAEGRLTAAVDEVKHVCRETSQERVDTSGFADLLVSAATSGLLKTALDEAKQVSESRLSLKELLITSATDGRLDAALSACRGTQPGTASGSANARLAPAFDEATRRMMSETRLSVRELLALSTRDGRLVAALSACRGTQPGTASGSADTRLDPAFDEATRRKMSETRLSARELLASSSRDGRLESALNACRETQQAASTTELLISSAHDGRLEKALKAIRQTQQAETSLAGAANTAQKVLTSAAADGRLEAALQEGEMEQLREATRFTLRRDAANGKLASVINEVLEARASKKPLGKEAALNGSLQNIFMRHPKKVQKAAPPEDSREVSKPHELDEEELREVSAPQELDDTPRGTQVEASSLLATRLLNKPKPVVIRRSSLTPGLKAWQENLETTPHRPPPLTELDLSPPASPTMMSSRKLADLSSTPKLRTSTPSNRRRIIGGVVREDSAGVNPKPPAFDSAFGLGQRSPLKLGQLSKSPSLSAPSTLPPISPSGGTKGGMLLSPASRSGSRAGTRLRAASAAASAMALDLGYDGNHSPASPSWGDFRGSRCTTPSQGSQRDAFSRASTPSDWQTMRMSQSLGCLHTPKSMTKQGAVLLPSVRTVGKGHGGNSWAMPGKQSLTGHGGNSWAMPGKQSLTGNITFTVPRAVTPPRWGGALDMVF